MPYTCPQLKVLGYLENQIGNTDRWIKEVLGQQPSIDIIRTINRFGDILVALVVLELDDTRRFSHPAVPSATVVTGLFRDSYLPAGFGTSSLNPPKSTTLYPSFRGLSLRSYQLTMDMNREGVKNEEVIGRMDRLNEADLVKIRQALERSSLAEALNTMEVTLEELGYKRTSRIFQDDNYLSLKLERPALNSRVPLKV